MTLISGSVELIVGTCTTLGVWAQCVGMNIGKNSGYEAFFETSIARPKN
jgi:hypothetical protein